MILVLRDLVTNDAVAHREDQELLFDGSVKEVIESLNGLEYLVEWSDGDEEIYSRSDLMVRDDPDVVKLFESGIDVRDAP